MLDFAHKAMAMAKGKTRDDLEQDEMLELAVARLVELVGEAASHVPRELQERHAQIPWEDIVGMRHHLAHGYEYVDHDILWDAITINLPGLVVELERIIAQVEASEEAEK